MKLLKWIATLALGASLSLSGNFAEAVTKKPATTKKVTKKPTKKPVKKPAPKKTTKKPTAAKSPAAPSYTPKYTPSEVRPPIPAPAEDEIVIMGTGDVMLGSTYPDSSGGSLPKDDGANVLVEVAPYLSAADLAFGNLEGPLLDGGSTGKCSAKSTRCYAFRVPTRFGKNLKDAGYDIMSLANNHALDFGVEGRKSSAKTLDDLGIGHSGEVGDIARMVIKGKKVSLIAFSNYSVSYNLNNIEAAAEYVKEEAAKADIVIVSFHGGGEGASRQHVPVGTETFLGENRGDLRKFSYAVIDAGADLVLGHGPHVMRGIEIYKDRLIEYSLGNFATYGGMNLSGPMGLTAMLEVRLNLDGSFKSGQIHPAKQSRPGGPKLDPAGEVIPLMQELTTADFPTTGAKIGDDGSISK